MNRAAALLRGCVRVRVESAFPERVLNLCASRGIRFMELEWESASAFRFTVGRRDVRGLRDLCEELEAQTSALSCKGLPFTLGRMRRRRVLLAGALVCALLLGVNACFIWDLQVEGNGSVPPERILRVLARCGVHRGTFVFSFRSHDVCNRALPELPELCWLTVNVRGCRAHVIVRERVPRPEIVNETAPTNVVSARDALVTDVRALDGEARVQRGATVRRGQLLISGIVDTRDVTAPTVATRYLAGKGEVWGRTWYELSVRIPLVEERCVPTGEQIRRHSLIWGEKRVKFYGKGSSIPGDGCVKMIGKTRWTLPGGIALPVTWETETLYPCTTVRRVRSRAEALARGSEVLTAYLHTLIGTEGSVTGARTASAERDGWLLVTLSAECREQIGRTVPIPIG